MVETHEEGAVVFLAHHEVRHNLLAVLPHGVVECAAGARIQPLEVVEKGLNGFYGPVVEL